MGDNSGSSSSAAVATSTGTAAQPDPLIGRIINDRFRIISMLARGGMGKVYKAEQAPLGRICAVKVLNPNYAGDSDPEFHKRFFLEASIASKLSHPNTVTIFDYGRTDDDIYYMAMEYLEGRTLHRLIREESPLDAERVIHIIRQSCRSLREAHGLGVIHRDLKPANIYLIQHDDERDFVKVLDFGLVKNVEDTSENLTQTGLFMGSPKYMAPEQIRGERVTPRTDVYALGVVMYEMLTGKVPFDRANSVNTLMAHVSEAVPPMRETNPTALVPGPVEELVYKCLQKRPEDRYGSMDELLAALKRSAQSAFGGYQSAPTGEFSTAALSGEIALHTGDIKIGGAGSSGDPAASSTSASGPIPREISPHSNVLSSAANPLDTSGTPFALTVPTPEKKSKTGLYVGAAVVALALVGGGVMMTRKGAEPAQTSAASRTPTPTAPANTAGSTPGTTAAPTPAPQVVRVALDSDPPGAEVFEGTTSLGRTPLRLEWTGEQGDPARAHTFIFRAPQRQEATVTLNGASLTYTATLAPVAPATTGTQPATTGTAPGTTTTRPAVNRPRPGGQRPAGQRPAGQRPAGYRDIDDWK